MHKESVNPCKFPGQSGFFIAYSLREGDDVVYRSGFVKGDCIPSKLMAGKEFYPQARTNDYCRQGFFQKLSSYESPCTNDALEIDADLSNAEMVVVSNSIPHQHIIFRSKDVDSIDEVLKYPSSYVEIAKLVDTITRINPIYSNINK